LISHIAGVPLRDVLFAESFFKMMPLLSLTGLAMKRYALLLRGKSLPVGVLEYQTHHLRLHWFTTLHCIQPGKAALVFIPAFVFFDLEKSARALLQ
jgi:hypothetical protein